MTTTGWTRIAIVCSGVWVLSVVFLARAELEAVAKGAAPTKGLAILRDPKTGKEFGRLSKSEIKELGRLEAEQARAEKKESKESAELLEANPEATLVRSALAKWMLYPLIGLWTAFLALRWIVAGFRDDRKKKTPNQSLQPTAPSGRG